MADMPDSDVELVVEALRLHRWTGTHEDVARALLGALAGAERLRADDSGVEVQLRAALAGNAPTSGTLYGRGWRDGLCDLAARLGIEAGTHYAALASCGRPWVAEIGLCPRCGLGADKH